MEVLQNIASTFLSTLGDVLPIVIIIIFTQLVVIRQPLPNTGKLLLGCTYVMFGISLFLVGLEQALFPIGKLMATQLTNPEFISSTVSHVGETLSWQDYYWVYIFAFSIGFSTTIAEPSLIAVAYKANEVSGGAINPWALRIAVGIGAAIGISLGTYRIVAGIPLHYFIISGYIIVVIQTIFAPKLIIALAYDSGGVTTSTVTVPLVTALGIGLASTVPGRSPLMDGFGLIAFTCLFPIITVIGYAQFAEWRSHRENRKARSKGE